MCTAHREHLRAYPGRVPLRTQQALQVRPDHSLQQLPAEHVRHPPQFRQEGLPLRRASRGASPPAGWPLPRGQRLDGMLPCDPGDFAVLVQYAPPRPLRGHGRIPPPQDRLIRPFLFLRHSHAPIFGVISFDATSKQRPLQRKIFGVINCDATRMQKTRKIALAYIRDGMYNKPSYFIKENSHE